MKVLGLLAAALIHKASGDAQGKYALATDIVYGDGQVQFSINDTHYTIDVDDNRSLINKNFQDGEHDAGRPLIGRRIHYRQADGREKTLDDQVFARFYIPRQQSNQQGPNGPLIYGGFEADGKFYRLNSPKVFLQSARSEGALVSRIVRPHRGLIQDSRNVFVTESAKMPTVNSIGGKRRPRGKMTRHRCGSEILHFNQHQHESASLADRPSQILRMPPRGVSNVAANAAGRSYEMKSSSKHSRALMGRAAASAACPANPQTINVGLVLDCNYVGSLNGTAQAQDQILSEMNLVSGIFLRTFNIDVSVIDVKAMDSCSSDSSREAFNVPCKDYPGLDTALNRFSAWRDTQDDLAGIWHLVTSCNYSDLVGLSWINQVCRTKSFTDSSGDTISGTSMSVAVADHFTLVAHEIAHNFGAIHDCTASNCSGSCGGYLECQCCQCENCDCSNQYIMKPADPRFSTTFSPCTVKDVCDKLPYIASRCLYEQSAAETQFSMTAVCGNGIREGSEECDCGGPAGCAGNPCCTPDCRLTAGSACSDNNDICCRNCQLIPAEERQVCSVSPSFCQQDAFCDGASRSCPKPATKPNRTACNLQKEGAASSTGDSPDASSSVPSSSPSGDEMCASGLCTSRNLQCAIFGRHLNITSACPYTKRSCTLICEGSDGQCYDLSANYVDGSSCGDSGICVAGMCSEFGSGRQPDVVASWISVVVKMAMSLTAALATLF